MYLPTKAYIGRCTTRCYRMALFYRGYVISAVVYDNPPEKTASNCSALGINVPVLRASSRGVQSIDQVCASSPRHGHLYSIWAPLFLLARDEIRDSLGSRVDVWLGCLLCRIDVWFGCINGLVGKVLSLVNISLASTLGRVCIRGGHVGELLSGRFAITCEALVGSNERSNATCSPGWTALATLSPAEVADYKESVPFICRCIHEHTSVALSNVDFCESGVMVSPTSAYSQYESRIVRVRGVRT